MSIRQEPLIPSELPISLIVDGYLKGIYKDEEDRLIPIDVTLLCAHYHGYSLCCLAAINRHTINIPTDETYTIASNEFYEMDHSHHSLNHMMKQNLTAALFTSIVSHHMRCFDYLMAAKKWKKTNIIS